MSMSKAQMQEVEEEAKRMLRKCSFVHNRFLKSSDNKFHKAIERCPDGFPAVMAIIKEQDKECRRIYRSLVETQKGNEQ